MESPSVHPRRRPQKATTPSLPSHAMSLRKSQTFNARTHITERGSPVEQSRYMPRRSPTCTKTLEDLVIREADLISHRQNDVAKLLQQFDDKISGRLPVGGDGSILNEEEVLAVPSFMVHQVTVPDLMDIDQKEGFNHHHTSDSGLGSSVTSSTGIVAPNNSDNSGKAPTSANPSYKEHNTTQSIHSAKSIATTHTAITKSASAVGSQHPRAEHFLSKDAERHIKQHIVEPILAEEALKDFHPLVEDIPRRIGAKFISNLRDLEKTLFFLAPDFAPTPRSFLKFCETSIECLHTTVEYLAERDQRLPSDRPYTNNYFLDLVEQIRRYAEIMARTREKQASGEPLDEMDFSPDEEVAIEGGLSKNGKPAELVRKKDGKVIPLSERSALNEGSPSAFKRPLTDDDEMDDDVYRSMARRRKSDKPGDVMHPCSACDKEFKRPCDLTKHEKTHSRPWKCSEPKCRYYEQGWPTEKERDRHVNDKHSAAPQMYQCKFKPCSYSSKRESNCKQHMEKAHGWEYVRSKSNGRSKKPATSSSHQSPSDPLTPFMTTPSSNNLSSPDSNFMASPSVPPSNNFGGFAGFGYTPGPSTDNLLDFNDYSRRESITTAGSAMTYNSDFSPVQPMSAFENALSPDEITFNQQTIFDTNALGGFSMPVQQPTPAMSINHDSFGTSLSPNNQHLSPHGQADLTLFSPHMPDNMHFTEALEDGMGFGQDFQLFDNAPNANVNVNQTNNWFPDMGTIGGQFDHFYGNDNGAFGEVFGNQL